MNKTLSLLLALVMLAVMCNVAFTASAEEVFPDNALIIVGGKVVTKDMTDADVVELFGEPVLKTASVFGGYAYTFYGDNYSDYLYIETLSNGEIAVYASVGEGFRSRYYSFGDFDDWYVRGVKVTSANDDGDYIIYGFYGYNYSADIPDYKDYNVKFAEENHIYMPLLCQHSVHMFNALSVNYGYNTPIYYDEYVTQMCIQLNDSNTDVFNYSTDRDYTGYTERFSWTSNIYDVDREYIANPMQFAGFALNYSVDTDKRAIGYTYYYNGEVYCSSYCCLNPQLFSVDDSAVEFTDIEKTTIKTMTEMYNESVKVHNSAESYYDTEPQYEELPLTAGKINENVVKGSLQYLNLIRYGGGLPALELNSELIEGAQAKATYSMYLGTNSISNPSPHFPPKVDGISDEFYDLCQTGGGENLFWGDAITSILKALDDGYGDPVSCGHRRNLLNPGYSRFGVGTTNGQGVHKFSGYQEADYDFVCWPSNGITPTEALYRNGFQWTISANSYKYSFNRNTSVEIKLLNTGDSWSFSNENPDFYQTASLLSFNDDSLTVSKDNVYEVTIKNVTDLESGKDVDYTYRSVIVSLTGSTADVDSVKISKTEHSGYIGDIFSLKAQILPEDADNLFVTWESSDMSVAEVNNCGVVTLKAEGKAVITATSKNGSPSASCTVTVTEEPETTAPPVTETASAGVTEPSQTKPYEDGTSTSEADPTEAETSSAAPLATDPSEVESSSVTPLATDPSEVGTSSASSSATDPTEVETSATASLATDSAEITTDATDAYISTTANNADTPGASSSDLNARYLLGDANLDSKINIKDATIIQKYAANIVEFSEEQCVRADANEDAKVNVKDATAIQKFLAGIDVAYRIGEYLI